MMEKKTVLLDDRQFDIWTDAGDMLESAVINWSARTEMFTAQSLCDYINSKGLHTAHTSNPNQKDEVIVNLAGISGERLPNTETTIRNTKAYNEGLTAEQVLSILKEAKGGTWYDGWMPYCIMRNADGSYEKCSSPRMHRMPWGFRCPDCGNEIGFNLKRIEI